MTSVVLLGLGTVVQGAPVSAAPVDPCAAPVDVIACENMVGASQALKGYVMEHVPEESAEAVEEIAGFPNAAVDRIVPEYQA